MGIRENDNLGGTDPYSSSKACAELVCDSYRRSFGLRIATARAGNVIGGGDWAEDRLVPDVMRALYSKRSPVLRNPLHIRTWQHVLEPLNGYLMLLERMIESGDANSELLGPWNFGPQGHEACSVERVVQQLLNRWGSGDWLRDPGESVHETGTLRLDSTKARVLLGWQPAWNTRTAVDRVVDWHLAHASGADVEAVMARQLAEHHAAFTSASS